MQPTRRIFFRPVNRWGASFFCRIFPSDASTLTTASCHSAPVPSMSISRILSYFFSPFLFFFFLRERLGLFSPGAAVAFFFFLYFFMFFLFFVGGPKPLDFNSSFFSPPSFFGSVRSGFPADRERLPWHCLGATQPALPGCLTPFVCRRPLPPF